MISTIKNTSENIFCGQIYHQCYKCSMGIRKGCLFCFLCYKIFHIFTKSGMLIVLFKFSLSLFFLWFFFSISYWERSVFSIMLLNLSIAFCISNRFFFLNVVWYLTVRCTEFIFSLWSRLPLSYLLLLAFTN